MATTNTKAVGVAYADPAFESLQVGSSSVPIALGASGVLNGSYATTSASDGGDTRLYYSKLTWSGTGSGEVYRGFAVVSGAGAAAAGTINGAHFSCEMQGGTVSGAANGVRATIGGTSASPGGTLAAIQADSNFDAGATLAGSASWIRFTQSGSAKLVNLFNVPAAMVKTASSVTSGKTIKIVADDGTPYYLLASATA